jgi:2-polyprenyl-3-methyl-5-hydroxy-6-metoxy-1,4-benzoquinol methylase
MLEVITNVLYPVPPHMRTRHLNADAVRLRALKESIASNYHTGWRSADALSTERYEREAQSALVSRLWRYRRTYLPWIEATRKLEALKVLEIGCGTGASTLALAEQGARVTAIDVDEGSLQVARDRLIAYGASADIRAMNATEMGSLGEFEAIIFNACLEHMTVSERLESLRQGWSMLPAGGILVVVETPNRLWWFDSHTSKLPLFHALPDELAFHYARFSERENFRELYRDYSDPAAREHMLRRGRGVSFHEFDVAIGTDLRVISSLDAFYGWREQLRRSRAHGNLRVALQRRRIDAACRHLLRLIYPHMDDAWLQEYLYLIIEKR